MEYNSDIYCRKSIRLKGYDYSREGAYYVTICTKDRECLFGEISEGKMILNEYGEIVKFQWEKTAQVRDNVIIDEFIVMPNHLHGIIELNNNVGAYGNTPLQRTPSFHSPSKTVGAIIRGFKSAATKHINEIRQMSSIPLWQRNYYERIIRNEKELCKIREYIQNNPLKWSLDRENPERIGFNSLEDEIFR